MTDLSMVIDGENPSVDTGQMPPPDQFADLAQRLQGFGPDHNFSRFAVPSFLLPVWRDPAMAIQVADNAIDLVTSRTSSGDSNYSPKDVELLKQVKATLQSVHDSGNRFCFVARDTRESLPSAPPASVRSR